MVKNHSLRFPCHLYRNATRPVLAAEQGSKNIHVEGVNRGQRLVDRFAASVVEFVAGYKSGTHSTAQSSLKCVFLLSVRAEKLAIKETCRSSWM
jgi:hypothetical protein